MRRKAYISLFFILLLTGFLIGCTSKKQTGNLKQEETTKASGYDEVMDMVFLDADYEKQTVTLQNISDGTRYVLNYNGGTLVNSAYGSPITMEQVDQGELVQASFYYKNSKLKEIVLIKDSWEIESTNDVKIDRSGNLMKISNKSYRYEDKIAVFYQNGMVDLSQVHESDMLTIRGIGKKVCSVTVEKGHGYVVLKGYDSFVGGWVEVGNRIITSIKEDMIIVAPEGEYRLAVEKNGFGGYKNIVVRRDQETEVDVSDLKEDALQTGNIRFNIEPDGAVLKVAGVERDASELVALDYGVYKIVVTAEGYKSYEKSITVDSLLKSVNIQLKKEGEEDSKEEEASKEEKTTKEEETTETKTNYQIKITAPEESEVYFDGVYKGKAPVNFKRVSGSHTITLRKDGYITKSYTVEIDEKKEDISMAFPELEKKEGSD